MGHSKTKGRQGLVPKIPDLDGAILAASYKPFPFAVKRNGGDVGQVAFEHN